MYRRYDAGRKLRASERARLNLGKLSQDEYKKLWNGNLPKEEGNGRISKDRTYKSRRGK